MKNNDDFMEFLRPLRPRTRTRKLLKTPLEFILYLFDIKSTSKNNYNNNNNKKWKIISPPQKKQKENSSKLRQSDKKNSFIFCPSLHHHHHVFVRLSKQQLQNSFTTTVPLFVT